MPVFPSTFRSPAPSVSLPVCTIWRHTWEKGKQYLEKMATTILLFSIAIWFLGYFPRNEEKGMAYQQEHSFIGMLGKTVEPALEPLGFNWKMDVGLLAGVGAKELVVSTLGVMYAGDEGAVADENSTARVELSSLSSSSVSVICQTPITASLSSSFLRYSPI